MILSDGSKLISSKEIKVLPDGNTSTIWTTVHIVMPDTEQSIDVVKADAKVAHQDLSLHTFDGIADHMHRFLSSTFTMTTQTMGTSRRKQLAQPEMQEHTSSPRVKMKTLKPKSSLKLQVFSKRF